MKKLILLLVLSVSLAFSLSIRQIRADYNLPQAYNLSWTVTNPGPGLYEGYSQYITIGTTPTNIVFILTNRISSTLPSYYRLVISSVQGGYTDEIDLLYAYQMNFIDWKTITNRVLYSDTRYCFRIQSTTAGSISAMGTYLESNSAVYQVSTLASIMSYNDTTSFEYGYNSGLESARNSLGIYDTSTSSWIGYNEGYEIGYVQGYGVGITEDLNVTSLWTVVISFIGSVFTLEIFPNVTLGLMIATFIGFFFIKWFLKMVRG